jgi:small conductance mechanosensitive channel
LIASVATLLRELAGPERPRFLGVVEQVRMFAPVMRSGDSREVIVPDGQIYGGTITNYSARETRPIDLVFGIGYNDDIAGTRQIIEDIMHQVA